MQLAEVQLFNRPTGVQNQDITFNLIAAQGVGSTLTVSASASSGLPVTFTVVQNGNCSVSGNVVTAPNLDRRAISAPVLLQLPDASLNIKVVPTLGLGNIMLLPW
jgi:hypothetical protein